MVRSLSSLPSFVLVLTTLACRVTPLVDPAPLAVSGASSVQVHDAVIHAMARRGWQALSDEPGEIVAENNVRDKHLVRVSIRYDAQNVSIHYLGSENLHYRVDSNGKATIHSNYAAWVDNLRVDILGAVTLLRVKGT